MQDSSTDEISFAFFVSSLSSRPKNTDEVSHQTEVIAVLKSCIRGGDVRNIYTERFLFLTLRFSAFSFTNPLQPHIPQDATLAFLRAAWYGKDVHCPCCLARALWVSEC